MRRRLQWFGALALAAVAGCGGEPGSTEEGLDAPSGGDAAPGEAVFSPDEPTELWFVELGEPSLVRGGDPALHAQERALFQRASVDVGLRYRQRFTLTRLWNGLSVQVGADAASTLAAMSGVKAIYPVLPVELDDGPTDGASTSDMATAAVMTGADIVRSQLGFTGEKVKVGVIDTGIDYHHPDFGGCFGPGCKVAFGTDLVGDAYDGANGSTQPVPDDDPDDCAGHGSHVAGIIGAKGAVTGVAPDVLLGAYRVFGCVGSTNSDVMAAALERAVADGMRVVNMSIGSPFQWPQYPTAVSADAAFDSGTVVVTSTGNSGALGLWTAGAPGTGERVIATAAIQNTVIAGPAFTISPDDTIIGYNRATSVPVAPLSGSAPFVRTGTVTTTNDACNPLPAGSLTGAVALIRRGTCAFNIKAYNAQMAGAAGVVIYNNTTGALTPGVGTSPNIVVIPVVGISQADGALINTRMDQAAVTHTWSALVSTKANTLANQIVDFSSYGMTAALTFKPDIAAPGGSIYSTVPIALGSYDSYSGTSMASPHVAGTVALLFDARPGIPADRVRDILQNNAVPVTWSGNLAAGVPDNTYRQGAGIVRIDRAIQQPVIVSPGKLAVGESQAGPWMGVLTLENTGATPVTYQISHQAGVSTPIGNHWLPTHTLTGGATVDFGSQSVAVSPGGTAEVHVTITANAVLEDGSLYGGWIVFTPEGGQAADAIRVPYAGFKGDYQTVPVITPADQAYPWIGRRNGTTYTKQLDNAVFSLQNGDIPYVVIHLDHNASRFTVDAYEASTMKPWGRVRDFTYLGQNTDVNQTFKYSWNGTTLMGKKTVLVPNGDYILKVRALRALGDENNPAHWDEWTSTVIRIDHP